MRLIAATSRPVSRGSPRSASTTVPIVACEVLPDSASIAQSTASTPASAAAMIAPMAAPAVSWVWKWTGRATASLRARTSAPAAVGFSRPAMSLRPRTCAPAASISFAMAT